MYVKSKVTSKYQITLPKDIREELGVKKGDTLLFEDREGEVLLRVEKRLDPVKVLSGILKGEDLGNLKSKAASKMVRKKLGLK